MKTTKWTLALLLAAGCGSTVDETPQDTPDMDLSDIALERGWIQVADEEVAAVAEHESLTLALKERVLFVSNGKVYRVPIEDVTAAIPEGVTQVEGWAGGSPVTAPGDVATLETPDSDASDFGTSSAQIVIGTDNRIPIPPVYDRPPGAWFPSLNVSRSPYRQLARIQMWNSAFPTSVGLCSGAFVGPRHVLTAGHCFDPIPMVPNTISVSAGASGGSATQVFPSNTFFLLGSDVGTDLALIILQDTATAANIGWYGWETVTNNNAFYPMDVYGYPGAGQTCNTAQTHPNSPLCGDSAGNRILYRSPCMLSSASTTEVVYTCDTSGGMSGGPAIRYGTSRVGGVHRGPRNTSSNRATPLNLVWATWMCGVAATAPSSFASYNCLSGNPDL